MWNECNAAALDDVCLEELKKMHLFARRGNNTVHEVGGEGVCGGVGYGSFGSP